MRARWPTAFGACTALVLTVPSLALGHATLAASEPAAGTAVDGPARVALTFTEPVSLLDAKGVSVVDSQGESVATGEASRAPRSRRRVEIPLRARLPAGTYTVRYRILSADSHTVAGVYLFGIGGPPSGEPAPAKGGNGPGENSPWSVAARVLELVCLGGMLGLLAFRWLAFAPAWTRVRPGASEPDASLRWLQTNFWRAFSTLAFLAPVAEAFVLLTKSANVLGLGLGQTLTSSDAITQVLQNTRFGALAQARFFLLVALFMIAAWEFLAEPLAGSDGDAATSRGRTARAGTEAPARPARPAGRPLPAALIAGILIATLALVSAQGHASTAPVSALSILADVIHVSGASIWIGGLGMLVALLTRLPRAAPTDGPAIAGHALARFSKVALAAVTVVVATGTLRSVAELSAIPQLWDTAYGRSILYKLGLLIPVGVLALRNRRVTFALRRVARPNLPTLRMVRTAATAELTLTLVIVVVASVLVAQVPGRIT